MEERGIEEAAAVLSRNPLISARVLMALSDRNSDLLDVLAPALLKKLSEGPGGRFLLALLRSHSSSPSSLFDSAFFSPAESEKLTEALSLVAQHATHAEAHGDKDAAVLRLMQAMNLKTIHGGLLLPALFLHHRSPRVRSQAALAAPRSDHHRDWLRFLRMEHDARVRANVIEALWDTSNESAAELFRAFAHDPDPRVAANSVVGLHKLNWPQNVEEAAALLIEIARSPDPRFTASAAWAMGATGDTRYVPSLGDLIKRSGPHVKCALQSLRNLQTARAHQA